MTLLLTDSAATLGLLYLTAIGLPPALALTILHRRLRSTALVCAPWAALPALLVASGVEPGESVTYPWLLLGTRLGVDATARPFLLFSALLWTCAGVYARGYLKGDAHSHRFFAFFLATMSGNVGLILAQDMVTFYLFFALMSFAAYGLVVYDGSIEARRAGTIYLSLVIVGEVLLVPGLLLTARATGTLELSGVAAPVANAPTRDIIVALMLTGFGIKVGALPLHVWLPLAHPVAPTPASAVLSGAMIKAGLLGWLRFLPLGEAAAPGWGNLCIAVGFLATFYGVIVGLTQDNPKTVLAYSSISQMGFMTIGVGVGLSVPALWPAALAAISLYAFHHGLAKGSLFLGVGVARGSRQEGWERWCILLGLLLPALALAGAPFTSGALAKVSLKAVVGASAEPWSTWASGLLPCAAVGTTLLLGRFLFLLRPGVDNHGPRLTPLLWGPWAALLLGVLLLSWLFVPDSPGKALGKTLSVSAVWPVLVGALVSWTVWRWRGVSKKLVVRIPPGDLLAGAEWLWGRCSLRFRSSNAAGVATRWLSQPRQRMRWQFLSIGFLPRVEEWFSTWTSAGLMFLALLAAAFSLLALR